MITVNIEKIRFQIDQLSNLINEYEEIKLNIFEQLKDACVNWKDGNSVIFDNEIYQEKKETDLLLQFLNDNKKILLFAYNKYKNFGKKIFCNLDKKTEIINNISICQNHIDNILYDFEQIDNSFYYYEKNLIINQKNNLLKIKKQLEEYSYALRECYKTIEEIELEIKLKIEKLSFNKIRNFEYEIN